MNKNKVALMLSQQGLDGPLASRFGKGKWLLFVEGKEALRFRRNEGLSGGWVTAAIVSAGCRDLIAEHLGERAHAHLTAAGVRVWEGIPSRTARELVAMFERNELSPRLVDGGAGDVPRGNQCQPVDGKHRADRDHDGKSPREHMVQLGKPRTV